MTPQALAKLDLLAAAKEAALLEALDRHGKALQRYEAQREVLAAYRDRLAAGWRNGAVVRAGDAKRAGQFSTQAEAAALQLMQAMDTERAKFAECAAAMAELRARRRRLRERLEDALRLEETKAQERAAQNRPNLPVRPLPNVNHWPEG
jgi:hypothetical protein